MAVFIEPDGIILSIEYSTTLNEMQQTGLVIAPPLWEKAVFLPQNTPKRTNTAPSAGRQ
jgi:hypothetical protein